MKNQSMIACFAASLLVGGNVLASSSAGQGQPEDEIFQRLQAYEIQQLFLPETGGEAEIVPVQMYGGAYLLELKRHSLFAEDFELFVQTDSGMEQWPAPEPTTYRGTVLGIEGSGVVATLRDGGLWAHIVLPWSQELWIQPTSEDPTRLAQGEHVIYDRRDVIAGNESCGSHDGGTAAGPVGPTKPAGSNQSVVPTGGSGSLALGAECYSIADIAFDADYEYFQANGSSVAATVNDITQLMNSVEAIFRDHTEVVYEIGTIIVRTTSSDPYTATAACNATPSLLDQFRTEWNMNQTGTKRDVAALMTGVDLDGNIIGCASPSAVCDLTRAYSINQAKFTTTYSLRVALLAHELGHNWSAGHCDAEVWCEIMCSLIGGCSGSANVFTPVPDIAISTYRFLSTCLSDVMQVDGNAVAPFHGTSARPYDCISTGASCSMSMWTSRREVRIQAGAYNEGIVTISDFTLLKPVGGVVTLD